jgi:alkanesulfonate monooxygenase SsuD/methylene tetrahydromethanopterin reductase-like flavin-dependent oxidoreductase (luciferase family)
MRIVALLTPTPDGVASAGAARIADDHGLDGIGFWDHYQSFKREWAYTSGWSAMAAVGALTSRVKLVAMVLNNLHYDLGVLAKESSTLSQLSGGRFELGIGAGDWPESFAAWGQPFPDRDARLGRLRETVEALRLLWLGQPVDYDGRFVNLRGATCTPAPGSPPRIVVGVGGSRRTLEVALPIADELNLYPNEELVAEAQSRIRDADRPIALSLHWGWEWDQWPPDPRPELDRWAAAGIDRVAIALAGDDMPRRIDALADWSRTAGAA